MNKKLLMALGSIITFSATVFSMQSQTGEPIGNYELRSKYKKFTTSFTEEAFKNEFSQKLPLEPHHGEIDLEGGAHISYEWYKQN